MADVVGSVPRHQTQHDELLIRVDPEFLYNRRIRSEMIRVEICQLVIARISDLFRSDIVLIALRRIDTISKGGSKLVLVKSRFRYQ